jgi:hypothetical protein
VWLNLAHVCREWRAVMFGSTSRLDLGITVRPMTPDDIETILSGPWQLFINFYGDLDGEMTDSALWHIRAALKRPDRVRDIFFAGPSEWFDEFFRAANCPLPKLESLVLCSSYDEELKIPDTFLGGPDQSNLHLQYLGLKRVSLTSIYKFLRSTSALTDLDLRIDTSFGTSPETSLLACLQGLPVLYRLVLVISSSLLESPPQPSTLVDIVTLSKLKYLRYIGQSVFLDAIAAGLSAPFLQDLFMDFSDEILSHIVHLPRFINETEKHYHGVDVTLHDEYFSLRLLTESEYTNDNCYNWLSCKFRLVPGLSTKLMRMSGALSTKLTTVEELRISFFWTAAEDDDIPCHRFFLQFPRVKVLHVVGITLNRIARTLLQGHVEHYEHADGRAFFPALEELELGGGSLERLFESELAISNPYISTLRQAGRTFKVYLRL